MSALASDSLLPAFIFLTKVVDPIQALSELKMRVAAVPSQESWGVTSPSVAQELLSSSPPLSISIHDPKALYIVSLMALTLCFWNFPIARKSKFQPNWHTPLPGSHRHSQGSELGVILAGLWPMYSLYSHAGSFRPL